MLRISKVSRGMVRMVRMVGEGKGEGWDGKEVEGRRGGRGRGVRGSSGKRKEKERREGVTKVGQGKRRRREYQEMKIQWYHKENALI